MTAYSVQQSGLSFLQDDVSRGSQSWTRTTTVTWGGHKIRTTILRDFYSAQSRIYSEVFSARDLSWNRVQTLSGADHNLLPRSSSKDDVEILKATNDLMNALIAYAQQILEGVPA